MVRIVPTSGGAERRVAEKEPISVELRMAKIVALKREIRTKMATRDQSDYEAITTMTRELRALAEQNASLDDTRLTLNDLLAD